MTSMHGKGMEITNIPVHTSAMLRAAGDAKENVEISFKKGNIINKFKLIKKNITIGVSMVGL